MKINLEALIKVFDERNNLHRGHTTSLMGILGEDLEAALFAYFLTQTSKVKNVEILSDSVLMGRREGPRLDRWIKADKILYQAEIKSWCCFQIGGYALPLIASAQKVDELAQRKWNRELREHYHGAENFGKVSKVLAPMNVPDRLRDQGNTITPLVIHWMPVSKDGTFFFAHSVKDLGLSAEFEATITFSEVHYFSCSLYVRELIKKGKTELDLDLPNVQARAGILGDILK